LESERESDRFHYDLLSGATPGADNLLMGSGSCSRSKGVCPHRPIISASGKLASSITVERLHVGIEIGRASTADYVGFDDRKARIASTKTTPRKNPEVPLVRPIDS